MAQVSPAIGAGIPVPLQVPGSATGSDEPMSMEVLS